MIDYTKNLDDTHEVFDCTTGETIANCATLAIAWQLIELLEGV